MFKITGFDKSANGIEDVKTLLDDHGVWGATGRKNTYKRKGSADIQKIQTTLKNSGARLDK